MFHTLVEAVLSHAKDTEDRTAVICKDNIISYRLLAQKVRNAAAVLKEKYGIRPADRVMLTGLSRPEYLVMMLGVQYLHAVTVPLDKMWMEDTVLSLFDFISPKLIISDMQIHREDVPAVSLKGAAMEADAWEGQTPEYTLPDPDAVAEMLFTTGTTGKPKGVMLTYGNIAAITANNITAVGFTPDEVVLNALPLFHSLGLREARMTLHEGAALVLQNGFAFPKELKSNVEKYHCTGFVCVPAIMERLTRQVPDFETLFRHFRYIEIGAGSLSYDLRNRLPRMLPDTQIYNTWGSSETGGVIFLDVTNRQDKITALGKPVDTAKVKAVAGDGSDIEATDIDHAGRLAVSGSMVMAGYYNMPDVNAQALVDGWLYTNDLVYMDTDGFVYMLGRADDIINVGGEKVSPIEIENTATEYQAVTDAACIGVPDQILGQVPVLYVAAQDPFNKEDLVHFLSERLPAYKLPAHILRIDTIPRNRMEKLDRKAVRKLWDEGTE